MGSYEGTGRSLSLKLVQQLREKDRHAHAQPQADGSSARVLREIALETPIRHAAVCVRRGCVVRHGGRAGGRTRMIHLRAL
jgi:tRNA(Met) C34 N-acetyltransferase TmcA